MTKETDVAGLVERADKFLCDRHGEWDDNGEKIIRALRAAIARLQQENERLEAVCIDEVVSAVDYEATCKELNEAQATIASLQREKIADDWDHSFDVDAQATIASLLQENEKLKDATAKGWVLTLREAEATSARLRAALEKIRDYQSYDEPPSEVARAALRED